MFAEQQFPIVTFTSVDFAGGVAGKSGIECDESHHHTQSEEGRAQVEVGERQEVHCVEARGNASVSVCVEANGNTTGLDKGIAVSMIRICMRYNEAPVSVAMCGTLGPPHASPVATEMGVSPFKPPLGRPSGAGNCYPATPHLHQRPDNPLRGLLGRVGDTRKRPFPRRSVKRVSKASDRETRAV